MNREKGPLFQQNLTLKQSQRQLLSPQMQKALHVLQLPILELSALIETEVEQNPLLEYAEDSLFSKENLSQTLDREDNDPRQFIENTLSSEISLHHQLLKQAHERLTLSQERSLAEIIIGYLDEWGFLSTPLEEISLCENVSIRELEPIVRLIQTFEPFGIAAKNVQESFLIQLKMKGRQDSKAYQIVKDHYNSILKNHILDIAKKMDLSTQEVRTIIDNEIITLNVHPGRTLSHSQYQEIAPSITPDVIVEKRGDKLFIEIDQERIPKIRFMTKYLSLMEDACAPKETKEYIKEKIQKGQWLLKILDERNKTLYRITEEIVKKQKAFFLQSDGKLKGFMMKEIAAHLSLHESTIVRAVANKYLSSPRGIFPLRFFFSHGFQENENLSAHTIKQLIKEMIAKENRKKPLSDEAIALQLHEAGYPCARRTIAKYRSSLGIGGTNQRRRD